jgi:hypothetical protein
VEAEAVRDLGVVVGVGAIVQIIEDDEYGML